MVHRRLYDVRDNVPGVVDVAVVLDLGDDCRPLRPLLALPLPVEAGYGRVA